MRPFMHNRNAKTNRNNAKSSPKVLHQVKVIAAQSFLTF